MRILGRLSTLIKSNVNDAIDSMQDPAKEIDQMIRDMEDSARQARKEVAECMASEKRLAKQVETLAGEVKTWEEHAMRAVFPVGCARASLPASLPWLCSPTSGSFA